MYLHFVACHKKLLSDIAPNIQEDEVRNYGATSTISCHELIRMVTAYLTTHPPFAGNLLMMIIQKNILSNLCQHEL